MSSFGFRLPGARLFTAIAFLIAANDGAVAQTADARIDAALQNITTLVRPGRVGYATVWDGNAYVQCRRMPEHALRCEAAGATLQPSLAPILTPERLTKLAAAGWALDPKFGNHVQLFPADMPTSRVANHIAKALAEAYGANVSRLEMQTAWVVDRPCPPRNGYSQNLAGMVNDAPAMRATAIYDCSYTPDPTWQGQTPVANAAKLFERDGARTTAEIQRLRINLTARVYVAFDAGIGYVQCMPQPSPPAIYCEAQSAASWPALAAILTPKRLARLRTAGYADPGRTPNFSRSYPAHQFSDAAIARELLTILHDVYGYSGAAKLKIKTE